MNASNKMLPNNLPQVKQRCIYYLHVPNIPTTKYCWTKSAFHTSTAIHIYHTMQNESLTVPYYNGDEGGGGWVGCIIYELVDSWKLKWRNHRLNAAVWLAVVDNWRRSARY